MKQDTKISLYGMALMFLSMWAGLLIVLLLDNKRHFWIYVPITFIVIVVCYLKVIYIGKRRK